MMRHTVDTGGSVTLTVNYEGLRPEVPTATAIPVLATQTGGGATTL